MLHLERLSIYDCDGISAVSCLAIVGASCISLCVHGRASLTQSALPALHQGTQPPLRSSALPLSESRTNRALIRRPRVSLPSWRERDRRRLQLTAGLPKTDAFACCSGVAAAVVDLRHHDRPLRPAREPSPGPTGHPPPGQQPRRRAAAQRPWQRRRWRGRDGRGRHGWRRRRGRWRVRHGDGGGGGGLVAGGRGPAEALRPAAFGGFEAPGAVDSAAASGWRSVSQGSQFGFSFR